jgi:hypothetical protein
MFRPPSIALLLALCAVACDGNVAGQQSVVDGAPDEIPPLSDDAAPGCTADVADTFYADSDGDGYGTADLTAVDCVQPAGFVNNSLDCDDADSSVNPDGTELCDGFDNDCSAATVEVCPTGCTVQNNAADIYLFCNVGANQAAASQICAAQEMHLVRIDDLLEQQYLSQQRVASFGGLKKTYIGASDLAIENTWVWQDGSNFWQGRGGGVPVDGLFSFWRGGEPNDDGTEDCAGMRDNSSSTGRWVDFECSQVVRYICERNPAVP